MASAQQIISAAMQRGSQRKNVQMRDTCLDLKGVTEVGVLFSATRVQLLANL